MKYLKMLGGAVVVAAALMALLGGGTASATVLCETETTPCPVHYAKGVEFVGDSVERTVFSEAFGPFVECSSSGLSGQISNAGGATSTVSISLSSLTWSECVGGTPTAGKLGSMEIHYAEKGRGTVTAPELEFAWGPCGYRPESGDMGLLTPTPKGLSEGELDVSMEFTRTNPFLPGCPSPILWQAEYRITSPQPLYVAPS